MAIILFFSCPAFFFLFPFSLLLRNGYRFKHAILTLITVRRKENVSPPNRCFEFGGSQSEFCFHNGRKSGPIGDSRFPGSFFNAGYAKQQFELCKLGITKKLVYPRFLTWKKKGATRKIHVWNMILLSVASNVCVTSYCTDA